MSQEKKSEMSTLRADAAEWRPPTTGAAAAGGGAFVLPPAMPGQSPPTSAAHPPPSDSPGSQPIDSAGETPPGFGMIPGSAFTEEEYAVLESMMQEDEERAANPPEDWHHPSGGEGGAPLPPPIPKQQQQWNAGAPAFVPGAPAAPVGDEAGEGEDWRAMMQKQIAMQLEAETEKKKRMEERMAKAAAEGKPLPPLTAGGKRRWPKGKAEKKHQQAQQNAFEAFANALLHSVSPFMAPLQRLCHTSLPHIKVDQRFGKRGAPTQCVAQFIVAPIVANYRPTHLHDLTPGDLMEFHYDFALVISQIRTAKTICVGYGPEWKPWAVPYCFLSCADYKSEVLKLCPEEIPNSKSEAVYEDDVVKDITDVILSIEELEGLKRMSFATAMKQRFNLAPLYDVFDSVFAPIKNYQIQIRNLTKRPSTFLLKTSETVLATARSKNGGKIVILDDPKLFDSLPKVADTFSSGKGAVVEVGENHPKQQNQQQQQQQQPAAAAAATAGVKGTAVPEEPAEEEEEEKEDVDMAAHTKRSKRDKERRSRKKKEEVMQTVKLVVLAVAATAAVVMLLRRKRQ